MPEILSHSEIEKIIEEYSHTKAGEEEIKARMGKSGKFVSRFEGGKPVRATAQDKARMKIKAREMVDILYNHIVNDTRMNSNMGGLSDFPKDAIVVGNLVPIGNTGNYKLYISFDNDALHRDSLIPDYYPDGLDNIIKLFVHGYNASRQVYGEWHGEIHASMVYRSPNDFIQRAVDEFNSINNGQSIIAEVEDEYK